MSYLDLIQGAQNFLHPIDAANAEQAKSQIREMRKQTQDAGFPFPDSPVSLREALDFYKPVQDAAKQKIEAGQKLQTQQQGDINAAQQNPPQMDPLELVRGIQRAVEQNGQTLTPEQMQGLTANAVTQGNVGQRIPITAKPSVFSATPSSTLLTAPENQQFMAQNRLNTPIQQEDLAQANQTLDLQKKQKESMLDTTTHVIKDPSTGEFRQVMLDKAGNWIKDLGPPNPEQLRAAEQAYKGWEGTINGRIAVLMRSAPLTDIEQARIAAAPPESQMALLAEIWAKKGLSKDAMDKLNTGMQELTDLRSKGYDMLVRGENPFTLLTTKPKPSYKTSGGDTLLGQKFQMQEGKTPVVLQEGQHFIQEQPDPAKSTGMMITDIATKQKYISDGKTWKPYKGSGK